MTLLSIRNNACGDVFDVITDRGIQQVHSVDKLREVIEKELDIDLVNDDVVEQLDAFTTILNVVAKYKDNVKGA
jgi:hypothetical protein